MSNIDDMAFMGYDYALSGGKLPIPCFGTDLDLMAFNAGISNANINHRLSVNQIHTISKTTYIDGRKRASEKTLGIIW